MISVLAPVVFISSLFMLLVSSIFKVYYHNKYRSAYDADWARKHYSVLALLSSFNLYRAFFAIYGIEDNPSDSDEVKKLYEKARLWRMIQVVSFFTAIGSFLVGYSMV